MLFAWQNNYTSIQTMYYAEHSGEQNTLRQYELCDSVSKASAYLHAAVMFLKQAQPSTEHTAVFIL
jgi:hypothetical protein